MGLTLEKIDGDLDHWNEVIDQISQMKMGSNRTLHQPYDPNETHILTKNMADRRTQTRTVTMTDEFPDDPDEQFDNDGDGVGNNADDFPDNKYASNWSTIYAAVGTLIVLLIGLGAIISRMRNEDELPNVPASDDLAQLKSKFKNLSKEKSQMLEQQDPTELMFED